MSEFLRHETLMGQTPEGRDMQGPTGPNGGQHDAKHGGLSPEAPGHAPAPPEASSPTPELLEVPSHAPESLDSLPPQPTPEQSPATLPSEQQLALADTLPPLLVGPDFRTSAPTLHDEPVATSGEHTLPRTIGRYEIRSEIGRGGMGVVYRAWDPMLDREVALKVLLAGTYASASQRERFLREARAAAQLDHASIIDVFDMGEHDGRVYFTMELIDGPPLQALVNPEGRMEPTDAARRLAYVARALHYAHQRGLVHRDIKPDNILTTRDGRTILTDFGLVLDLEGEHTPLTHTGQALGTPAFMAPEQARGQHTAVGPRSDIYSLGAVLYYLLTGQRPFTGATAAEVLLRVLTREPPWPRSLVPSVPVDLDRVCRRAMAVDPAERYASALELAEDLERYLCGEPVRAFRSSPMRRAMRHVHRYSKLLLAISLVAAVLVSWQLWQRTSAQRALAKRERYIFQQAQASLALDPTATLAWLKRASLKGPRFAEARELAHQAMAQGVARHLLPHGGRIYDMAFSPDGRTLVTAGQDALRRWDLGTGAMRLLDDGSGRSVFRLQFSPDGAYLAVAYTVGGGVVWRLADSTHRPLPPTREHIRKLRFLGGGSRISIHAESSSEGIWLWDVATGTYQRAYEPAGVMRGIWPVLMDYGRVMAAAVGETQIALHDADSGAEQGIQALPGPLRLLIGFPDDRRLLTQLDDGSLYVVDMQSNASSMIGHMPTDLVQPTFSADGRLFAAARAADRNIHLWDFDLGRHAILSGADGEIQQLVVARDGSFVAACTGDSAVYLWDVRTQVMQALRGHSESVVHMALSEDDRLLATAGQDGSVRIWELQRPRLLRAEGTPPGRMAVTDSRTMISYGYGTDVRVWDLATGGLRTLGRVPGELQPEGRAPAISPDGRSVAFVAQDGTVRIWTVATGEEYALSEPADPGAAAALVFSPRGDRLLAASSDRGTLVWDLATRRATVLVAGKPAHAAVFTADGRRVLLAVGQAIELWDVDVRQPIARVASNAGTRPSLARLAVSPNGLWAAAWTSEHRLWLYNVADGRPVLLAKAELTWPRMVFSPDSRELAVTWNERDIRVWPVSDARRGAWSGSWSSSWNGNDARAMTGHTGIIYDLAYTPDGERLLSVSQDGTARLWRTDTGAARVLHSHGSPLTGMALLPSEQRLVIAAQDGELRFLDLDSPWPETPSELRTLLDQATSVVVLPDERIGIPPAPAPAQ